MAISTTFPHPKHREVAQQAEEADAPQRPRQAQGPHHPDRAAPAVGADLELQ